VSVEPSARVLVAVLAGAIGAPACGGDSGRDAPEAERCPIGDISAPAEIEIVHLDAQNAVIKTQAMASVPLQAPPQGGWIVLLGARARNIDGCRLTLTTALIDACTNQIIQVDVRPTRLVPGSDGWGVSSVTTFGNLPVCPQATATRDLHDVPYIVRVVVEDSDGKKATAELTVVPVCPDSPPLCTCKCARDYVLGSACETMATDAGVPQVSCEPDARLVEPTLQ
jgi:hypothetical protein